MPVYTVSHLEDFNRHVHSSNDLRFLTMLNRMFMEYGVFVCKQTYFN